MIEIEDIKDQKSLKQWLIEWPKESGKDVAQSRAIAVTIAHRVAMRRLPFWWDWTLSAKMRSLDETLDPDLTALPILRCSLISGVAAISPTPEIFTYAARAATGRVVNARNAPPSPARNARTAATATAAVVAATTRAHAAIARTANAATAYAAGLNEIRTDCAAISEGKEVMSAPLWATRDQILETLWGETKAVATGSEWSFWIKWYDDALAGRVQNEKMLEQIALIEDEIWGRGAGPVTEEIANIVEKIELLDAVRSLKKARSPLPGSTASAAHRSHNQPPELVDLPAKVSDSITFVWASLDNAEKELEKPDPDVERLKEFSNAILRGIATVARYCARVGDTVIMAGAKGAGTAGGGLLLDYYFNGGRVLKFANRLLQYATGG